MTAPGTLIRRYVPFLALAAVQALLVVIVPSDGRQVTTEAPAGAFGASGALSTVPGASSDTVAGSLESGTSPTGDAAGSTAGGITGTGGTSGGTVSGGDGGGSGAQAATGDRSKCAKDGIRQQDVTTHSPRCRPKFTGDNGGSTYQGVTATEVKVLRYRPKTNQAVETALRPQGLAASAAEEQHGMETFAKFFEKHYEFSGRKINWVTVQGTCEITPPDLPCFRDEARRHNAQHKPFAVVWISATTQAEFFEQWSQLGVVNVGGGHFAQSFNVAHRPYHYDLFMDGTRTATNLAEYWCKKMQGKNATLAGDTSMHVKRRRLGIITQDFPVTRANALEFIRLITGGMCGSKADAAAPLYTPSDISRAQQTYSTAVQKFKSEGVTTAVIMSDPIAPTFFTTAASEQQWFPEHLLSGSGLIDYDILGRLYEQSQWVNAFGPGHLGDAVPFEESDASKAARDVGVEDMYLSANLLYSYMSVMSALIQNAGPTLTPIEVERGILNAEPTGGWVRTKNPAAVLVRYGPGDYTAIEDSRHTYWSPTATSKMDGKPGAYLAVEGGRRWELGTWAPGEPKK